MKQARVISFLANLFFAALFVGLPISKGVASVAVGGLLVLSVVQIIRFGLPKIQVSDWRFWMPLLLLFLLIISYFRSEDSSTAWKVLYRENTLLVIPLALAVFKELFQKQFRLYFQLFIIATSFCSLLTLFFFFLPSQTSLSITQKLTFLQDYVLHEKEYAFGTYSPFIDRLHFSYLLGTALFIQLWALFSRQIKSHLPAFILLMINLFCLLILGGRGAQLGFLLSTAVWLVFIYRQFLQIPLMERFGRIAAYTLLVLGLLVGIALMPYLAYRNIPAVQDRYTQLRWEIGTVQDDTYQKYPYEHFTSLRRLMSWKYTWEIIRRHPILGIGLGDHNTTLRKYYERDQLRIPINSHQQYLYYWAVAGILGFLLFLLLLWQFLRSSFQEKVWNHQALMLSFIAFYSIVFLLDSPLIYQTGSLAFWVFFLALVALKIEASPKT
ncbi:MAG: O-antigen ligase family protein [Bacteroidota bacterium]